MKKLYLVFIALPLLAACAAQSGPEAQVSESDLAGKHFVLESVNGEPFRAQRTPVLRFGDDMRVSGQACNIFNGPASLKNGVLSVTQMASTKMLCDDRLNKFERELFTLLHAEAALTLEDGRLILSGGGLRLEYRPVASDK